MHKFVWLVVALAATGCSGAQTSTPVAVPVPSIFSVSNAPATFYGDYTGPQRQSLLAVRAGGTFNAAPQTIVLDAQMAGPIFDGITNYYVWGFNRGGATNAPFPHEPNVIFDSVVVVTATPSNTISGVVNLLNGSAQQPVSVTLLAPDTIEVTIPAALLPLTTGQSAATYTWNLWPRSGVGGSATAQIASFIPQNAMAVLQSR